MDTAAEKGWNGLTNGDLMDRAEGEDYEVLITTDQNIRYQQNLTRRRLAVIVLLSTAWPYAHNIAFIISGSSAGNVPFFPRTVLHLS